MALPSLMALGDNSLGPGGMAGYLLGLAREFLSQLSNGRIRVGDLVSNAHVEGMKPVLSGARREPEKRAAHS